MAGWAGVAAVWSQVCWPLWSRCWRWGHQRAVAGVCAVVGLCLPDHQAVPLPLSVQWSFLGECTDCYNLDSVFWVACQCNTLLQRLPSYFHYETASFYNTLQQLACELSYSQSCWSFAPKCWLGCFVQYFDGSFSYTSKFWLGCLFGILRSLLHQNVDLGVSSVFMVTFMFWNCWMLNLTVLRICKTRSSERELCVTWLWMCYIWPFEYFWP